jgi:predicted secreted protein
MAETQASAGYGVQLQVDDGSGSFSTIAEVTSLSGPELSADTADVTHHQSPGGWEEHIPTILRSGEVSATINYLPGDSTQDASSGLLSLLDSKTKRDYKIIFPDAASTTWTLSAYVTGFSPSAPVDDRLSADVTLKATGQPTLA